MMCEPIVSQEYVMIANVCNQELNRFQVIFDLQLERNEMGDAATCIEGAIRISYGYHSFQGYRCEIPSRYRRSVDTGSGTSGIYECTCVIAVCRCRVVYGDGKF